MISQGGRDLEAKVNSSDLPEEGEYETSHGPEDDENQEAACDGSRLGKSLCQEIETRSHVLFVALCLVCDHPGDLCLSNLLLFKVCEGPCQSYDTAHAAFLCIKASTAWQNGVLSKSSNILPPLQM